MTCTDLVVNGTGKVTLRTHNVRHAITTISYYVVIEQNLPTQIQFNLSLPDPQNLKAYIKEDGWMNHSCSLELKPRYSHTTILVVYYASTIRKTRETTPQVCQLILKSFHGRLLPTCNENRGKEDNFEVS